MTNSITARVFLPPAPPAAAIKANVWGASDENSRNDSSPRQSALFTNVCDDVKIATLNRATRVGSCHPKAVNTYSRELTSRKKSVTPLDLVNPLASKPAAMRWRDRVSELRVRVRSRRFLVISDLTLLARPAVSSFARGPA